MLVIKAIKYSIKKTWLLLLVYNSSIMRQADDQSSLLKKYILSCTAATVAETCK